MHNVRRPEYRVRFPSAPISLPVDLAQWRSHGIEGRVGTGGRPQARYTSQSAAGTLTSQRPFRQISRPTLAEVGWTRSLLFARDRNIFAHPYMARPLIWRDVLHDRKWFCVTGWVDRKFREPVRSHIGASVGCIPELGFHGQRWTVGGQPQAAVPDDGHGR